MVLGRTLWWSAITVLMSPAEPAAALVWPIWAFTEPSAQRSGGAPAAPKTAFSACTSAASPALVEVPWASTSSTVSGP